MFQCSPYFVVHTGSLALNFWPQSKNPYLKVCMRKIIDIDKHLTYRLLRRNQSEIQRECVCMFTCIWGKVLS